MKTALFLTVNLFLKEQFLTVKTAQFLTVKTAQFLTVNKKILKKQFLTVKTAQFLTDQPKPETLAGNLGNTSLKHTIFTHHTPCFHCSGSG